VNFNIKIKFGFNLKGQIWY